MVSIDLNAIFEHPPEPLRGGGCGSCGNGAAGSRCGNGLEKVYPTTCVRFGYMKHVGEFAYAPNMRFTCGAKVIVQTNRGLEMGEQVSLTCNGCDKSVTREQMRGYAEASGPDTVVFDAGRIVREATMVDLAEYARIQAMIPQRRRLAADFARGLGLSMRIIECELLFGGERAIFYFSAEARVDFRQLVKDLSSEFQTRIEMRQIGARDEARLLADFETCGREVCCKVFLKNLKPISMKMAKLQKSTIDPTKVSGRCGRLKCCLRYEHTSYEELDKRLPRLGARIRTQHGDGVVINRQILTQLLQIQKDDEGVVTVVVEDVLGPDTSTRPSERTRPAPESARPPAAPDAAVEDAADRGRPGRGDADAAPPRARDIAAPPPPSNRPSRPGQSGQSGQSGAPSRREPLDRQRRRPPGARPDAPPGPPSPPPSIGAPAPDEGHAPPPPADTAKTSSDAPDAPPTIHSDGTANVMREPGRRPSPLHRRRKWKHRPPGRGSGPSGSSGPSGPGHPPGPAGPPGGG